jgi:hypothetical protein
MAIPHLTHLQHPGFGLSRDCRRIGECQCGRSRTCRGIATEVHPRDFVLRAGERDMLIDMSELGGITMAIEVGESIAAIGSIDSGGRTLHAVRLETTSHTQSPAKP